MSNINYKFKLLEESSETEDMLEEKTHERIAEVLYQSIYGIGSNGITIGLEGGWGTGKSTVISLLKTKIEPEIESRKTYFFYFDAWEHEGDPLRRIFLEELINQVSDNPKNDEVLNEKLKSLQERISRRKKITKTHTKHTATWLGKLLGLSTILAISLGTSLISNKNVFEEMGISTEVIIFRTGIFLASTPLFVLIGNLFMNFFNIEKRKKGIFSHNNWMFLRGETDTETIQETSEEEERSSIEFEKFFDEIINLILHDENSRLLIVIDNLDRINHQDSLKIWATLQTYLQQRNPSGRGNNLFKRIWTIVPYDETGLVQLWEKDISSKETSSKMYNKNHEHESAKSYFDKCFQLRLQLPRIMLSGWEDFCRKRMKESLIEWDNKEIESAINVLLWSREGVNDSPTPREIKTFINQVGILRTYMCKEVGVEAIAYFVIEKYLRSNTIKKIEDGLISGSLPNNTLIHAFDSSESIRSELSAIIFSTSPQKGTQMLLEPVIEKALSEGNGADLEQYCETHKGIFWTVLSIHTQNKIAVEKLSNYTLAVHKGLLQEEEQYHSDLSRCCTFITNSIPAENDNDTVSKLFPKDGKSVEHFLSFFEILKLTQEQSDISRRLYTNIGNIFIQQCKNIIDPFNLFTSFKSAIQVLYKIRSSIQDPEKIDPSSLEYKQWIKIFSELKEQEIELEHIFEITKKLMVKVASAIRQESQIPDQVVELIRYGKNDINEKWIPIVSQLSHYISSNNIYLDTISHSLFFEIINLLGDVKCEDIKDAIKKIIMSQQFYNMSQYSHLTNLEYLFVTARFMSNNQGLSSFYETVQEQGIDINQVIDWWKISDAENAQFVWSKATKYSDYSFLWHLATDNENKLIGNIIEIAMEEDIAVKEIFFSEGNSWENYKNTYEFFKEQKDDKKQKIAEFFRNHTQVEDEFKKIETVGLIEYSEAIYYLLKNTSSREIKQRVIDLIKTLTYENWFESLQNHGYPTRILLIPSLEDFTRNKLKTPYFDAYYQYAIQSIENSDFQPTMGKQEFENLFMVIHPDFQKSFSQDITKKFIDLDFHINEFFEWFLLNHFDHDKLLGDGKGKIQDKIKTSLKSSDLNKLHLIYKFLKQDHNKIFRPDSHLTTVLEKDFNRIVADITNDDKNDKAMIQHLASIFSIKVKY